MNNLRNFLVVVLAFGLLSCEKKNTGSSSDTKLPVVQANYEVPALEDLVQKEDAYHFYVIGDWGTNGDFYQKPVAEMMNRAAETVEPEFILSTGDNFYSNGVASTQDPVWMNSFEEIYKGGHLFVDWYVSLGNHDYRGNVQAQIDYTDISRRWNMPSRYYFFDKVLEDDETKARFIVLDTSPLNDEYYPEKKYHQVTKQDTTAQIKWLEQALASSDAQWNIVIGHHPMYTSGKRIEDPNFIRGHLQRLFEKYEVDAYFAGHEHDLQHQKPDDIITHHFISGSGAKVRPVEKLPYTKFAQATAGFMTVSLEKENMLVQVVNYKGTVVYSTLIKKNVQEL